MKIHTWLSPVITGFVFGLLAIFLCACSPPVTRSIAASSSAEPLKVEHHISTQKNGQITIKNRYFTLRLAPRTPDQMAAFYYGRGFPQNMIDEIKKFCMITVGLSNHSQDVIWMDLAEMNFFAKGEPVERFHRKILLAKWQSMSIPLRFQSTFRWTLLPESLDYRPDEREGGNIVLPRTGERYRLVADLYLGKQRDQGRIQVELENLICPNE